MVHLSRLRPGKNDSVAIFSPATEKSATAHLVPGLYSQLTSPQRRPGRSRQMLTYRGGWNCLSWPSIVAPIAYTFCLSPAFHYRHILSIKRNIHRDSVRPILCLRMSCVYVECSGAINILCEKVLHALL